LKGRSFGCAVVSIFFIVATSYCRHDPTLVGGEASSNSAALQRRVQSPLFLVITSGLQPARDLLFDFFRSLFSRLETMPQELWA
jgi:hypothetical protein